MTGKSELGTFESVYPLKKGKSDTKNAIKKEITWLLAEILAAIPIAVKAPAAGVFAPASKLTTDLANPPVTGNPPDSPEPTFENPRAINS